MAMVASSCGKGRFSDMKRARQYIGILAAAAAYYSIHEGAHLLCAVLLGTFKQIRFIGIGMQIDVYNISHIKSKLLRAVVYYITIALLLLDPLYLSTLCGFFGGGDMNGISLLCPEWITRSVFAGLLIVNAWIFWKRVLPVYKESFSNEAEV